MTHWTVRKRIIFSLTAIIFIMAALSVFAFIQLVAIQNQAAFMTRDSLPGIYLINQISAGAKDKYALALKHILTDDQERMRRYESQIEANKASLDELMSQYEKTITLDEDQQLFSTMTDKRSSYLAALETVTQSSRNDESQAAQDRQLQRLDEAYTEFMDIIRTLVAFNRQTGQESTRHIQQAVAGAQIELLIGLLMSFIIAAVSGYFLVRAINQPLNRLVGTMDLIRQGDFSQRLNLTRHDEFGILADGLNRLAETLAETQVREQATIKRVQQAGITVTGSSTSLAATIREQEATVTEQAASSNQITASTQEIAATSREFVRTIQEVTHMAEEAGSRAEQGRHNLEQLNTTMQRMVEASNGIVSKLQVLNEKAGNINTVVNTITKVADQTNLLSLNAAIEAEKAGEYGRGFSVVATEIRRLADQTAVASWDIEQMLKEMQSAVSASVMGMDKFSEEIRRNVAEVHQVGALLSNVIEHTQSLLPRFEAVHQGMQAQNQGAEQITTAMGQLNESMQQTVESLSTVKESVHMLNEAARSLQAEVAQFKVAA